MDKSFTLFQENLNDVRLQIQEPLEKFTSLRIGGRAHFFFKATTIDELVKYVLVAQRFHIPYFILGGGTNTLFPDAGFAGLVIRNEAANIRLAGIRGGMGKDKNGITSKRRVFLEVDSGTPLNRLVRYTIDAQLSGLQSFLGQPGTVGGALYMNAHNIRKNAFFGDYIIGAKLLTTMGKIIKVDQKYFRFGYDTSHIQKTKDIVLSVVIGLSSGIKDVLWGEAQENLTFRINTQPKGVYSAGCTFQNISKSDAVRLSTPQFTCSAGYLLDRAGLKGERKGNVSFSTVHANFIVHNGAAKASDVLELIRVAKNRVREKFAVTLQEEIVIVGELNG